MYFKMFRGAKNSVKLIRHSVVGGKKILVPKTARKETLKKLHLSHNGLSKTLATARSQVIWPGMKYDIEILLKECSVCTKFSASKQQMTSVEPQPNMETLEPSQRVGTDLFSAMGYTWIVIVDASSGFIRCRRLPNGTFKSVKKEIMGWMNDYGRVKYLRSDNGPPYQGKEFKDLMEEKKIIHEKSSPYHPQGNGRAEEAVKRAKGLLVKIADKGMGILKTEEEFQDLLYEQNASLKATGDASAASLFLGRIPRTGIPSLPQKLKLGEEKIKRQEYSTAQRKSIGSTKGKTEFRVGQKVICQNPISKKWDETGIIQGIQPNGRSYTVKMQKGKIKVRSGIHLKENKNASGRDASRAVSAGDNPTVAYSDRDSESSLESVRTQSTVNQPINRPVTRGWRRLNNN